MAIRLGHALALLVTLMALGSVARADDGYRLWLRYDPLPAANREVYRARVRAIVAPGNSPTIAAAREELRDGCSGLLGQPIPLTDNFESEGVILLGTPQTSKEVAALHLEGQLAALGPEGFIIRAVRLKTRQIIVIAAQGEAGALYGAFRFLRLLQTLGPIDRLNVSERPRLQLRVLDHWDNLDGSIERGYAGQSLWNWSDLPDKIDPRLRDYARANASIGINGATLNNVNANAQVLTADYLRKVAAIAGVFRPYGIRIYLSARFSAPIEIGGLPTADPMDPEVAAWWRKKADEIYRVIPDFGGFLVKANSEGQPGPRTYNRTHADGANMLAAAVAPHQGVVIWRAFVYDAKPGYDRASAAYAELQPFDGKFAPNVLLQVKNGPIDYQPREPFHPLFGAMPRTQVIPEFQITQEYLGWSNHLAFLAPMWREFFDSDTFAKGPGSTVTKVADGSLYHQKITGIAGVANTGSDRNWTGHHFAQANWYAFGRLAWNPEVSSEQIAREWIAMTLTHDAQAGQTIARLMLESHEAVVDYMTPLGLHHLFWGGHHYGPAPWWDREKREDWNPVYFHRAAADGIGFDRTATGSNNVAQYHAPVRDRFANLDSCPEKFLLWFHHVPWDYRLHSQRTLWDEMGLHYQRGVDWVRGARKSWDSLKGIIDDQRLEAVAAKLAIQERDAIAWRDACLLYFQTFSKRPLPAGVEKPLKTLEEYKAKSLLEIDSAVH
ncbi:MAG TPA: alpha-glucuronidase family glycosyl hydrolase [Pyrinomonadaceae bacterium]|nr:alpha-glucuronidase family glycosyl hydrolase [Pyrinomonadaceae bacterium]